VIDRPDLTELQRRWLRGVPVYAGMLALAVYAARDGYSVTGTLIGAGTLAVAAFDYWLYSYRQTIDQIAETHPEMEDADAE